MDKFKPVIYTLTVLSLLPGCVTREYAGDNTPVVQNDATNDDIALTRISLALGYLKMGNTTQAKANLEKARRFAPKLVQVYTAFAHYYETVGEQELAVEAYEQALSLDPDDADTLNNYGVFLCRQERLAEAEQEFLKAIAVPSYLQVAQSYENLALCHLKADNFNQAEQYIEKAIQHNPSRAAVILQMVELQYAKGDYRQAQAYLQQFEKAVRRFSAEALALAFKLYRKQGKNTVAKNYAVMLVKMFPTSWQAKQYLVNELAQIPADELALRYRQSEQGRASANKPVVVLSPDNKQADNKPRQLALTGAAEPKKQAGVNKASGQKPSGRASQPQTTITIPVHVVESGDSLFSISKKYNIFMRSIQRWNNLKESSILRVGDVIYLSNPNKAAKS
ncbi:type IV pilus biogenesis/stability protein PilW [Thalassomonas viridans]|uniref:Type IV pilus biogenesis/stability protein PilW n=1 Tax=Thalassomonas viridans TaxID=137584 RepID=A0AAE9Z4Q5_9GAMM|nr:type IV pilus biogenesis/stability protein PilW [Thalassomonas viridans]WDE06247.1 type IV pilus biogenesis/stability protein PilW [Thalassomonas viridans]